MIKRVITVILTLSFLLALVSAVPDLEIKKVDKGSVVIAELQNPAVFDFIITNNGGEEYFEIYSITGLSFAPKEKILIPHGTKTLKVLVWPNEDLRKRNELLNIEYQIKGDQSGILKDTLSIKVVPLSEVLEISVEPLLPTDSQATIKIRNRENTLLENVMLDFESEFLSDSSYVSLGPYEEKEISLPITKDISKLLAGPYILKSEVQLQNKNVEYESIIDYLEKEGISVNEVNEGFIIHESTITKTNKGNVPLVATISVKKDALSRLFTLNSPTPISTEREGFSIVYTWQDEISPTETLEVVSTTNYTIPLIILVLIVLVGVFAKIYSQTALVLNKKVSFVKTKTGELALKVNIRVKARKYVDKIQIVDTLPGMTVLYEKFGKMPDRIENTSRRLFWDISSLNAGEERVISYIIYSKLKVVGRFELPAATAVFNHEGRIKEAWSNRTFFVSGQTV